MSKPKFFATHVFKPAKVVCRVDDKKNYEFRAPPVKAAVIEAEVMRVTGCSAVVIKSVTYS